MLTGRDGPHWHTSRRSPLEEEPSCLVLLVLVLMIVEAGGASAFGEA